MTANMVPVGVSNEHGCQRRQSRRIGLQRFVCTFGKVRSRARVNADELMPVLGNYEVVFRKFEAGQGVDATGNDLDNAPRCKRMTRDSILGKRRCQRDWVIEIGIAAAPQVLLGFCSIPLILRESAEMI